MKRQPDFFREDIEIPEIVNQKMEKAFTTIRQENLMKHTNTRRHETRRRFRTQAAAAACVCLLTAGGITSYAAIRHFWGNGMNGTLQATEEQQQKLTESGTAVVLKEQQDYKDLSVTSNGITVTPETIITDKNFTHISFTVSGYALPAGREPAFESKSVYLGEDPDADENQVNMSAGFYNGLVADEHGSAVYEDGSPLQYSEDGSSILEKYADENGSLSYVITIFTADNADSLLGKTLHCNFENIGTVAKATYEPDLEGSWDFTLQLPEADAAITRSLDEDIPETLFTIKQAEISPISIQLTCSTKGTPQTYEDENGIPYFSGVVLKDGTRLPYLADGGRNGYTDETMTEAYLISCFDRVIDPEQIASLLFRPAAGGDLIEVSLEP